MGAEITIEGKIAIIKGVDYNYGTIINSETIMWDGTMEFDNAFLYPAFRQASLP